MRTLFSAPLPTSPAARGGSPQHHTLPHRYDPASGQWSALGPFPGGARSYAIGDVHPSLASVYFGFGRSATAIFRDLWRYDGTSWTQLASCPPGCERFHPAFVALQTKVFVAAGSSSGGNLKSAWAYDIARDEWEQLPDLPGMARHHPYQFLAAGQPHVFGGHGNGIYRDLYRWTLNAGTGSWERQVTLRASLPSGAEGRVAGTQFSAGGSGYVLSGDGQDQRSMVHGEFWRYIAGTDSWEQLPSHPGASRPARAVARCPLF